MTEFTDEHRRILAEAREQRPECVLEVRDGMRFLWRSAGNVWRVSGTFADSCRFSQFTDVRFGYEPRDNARLATALRESRVLGLDSPATTWVDDVAREHGIAVTWRVSDADKLYENGCAFCGAADPTFRRRSGPYDGVCRYCQGCQKKFNGGSTSGMQPGVDAEYARRLSLASQPAKAWIPQVGDHVSGNIAAHSEPEDRKLGRVVLFSGTVVNLDTGWTVWKSSLRPYNASARAVSVDDAARETASVRPSGQAPGNSTQPAEPRRQDQYANTTRQWSDKQDAIHARKVQQALDQLNSPLRLGPMRNRDRYGQKLSLLGWETEDEP